MKLSPINIMLDIETLGIKVGSPILSIGAVLFSEEGMNSRFYCTIDPKSLTQYGYAC